MIKKVVNLLLEPLESREQQASYKPLHRRVLLVLSGLFCALALAVLWVAPKDQLAAFLPVVIFFGVGLYGLLVGILGSDRAVANLWFTNRKR